MTNELIWLLLLLGNFTVSLIALHYFGRAAILPLMVLELFICNTQVVKLVSIFGMTCTLGNVAYGMVYWLTDLTSEVYGKKTAIRYVWLLFLLLILLALNFQATLWFNPHPEDIQDSHLKAIFGFQIRAILASLVAFLVSQLHDVWAFEVWRRFTKGRWLWLRNNASTLVSQLIDTTLFTAIAFWGLYPTEIVWGIFVSTICIKSLVTLLDTPFLYAARSTLRHHDARL